MKRSPFELPGGLVASLVLVRHGESTWVAEGRFQGRGNPPLSELGERQAELVADRLARPTAGASLPIPAGPPVGVWHSPLARAAQTAQVIVDRQPSNVDLIAEEGLGELAQGEWEGLLHSEVHARWPELLALWRTSPTTAHAPGGEPLLEAAARIEAAATRVIGALHAKGPGSAASVSAEEAGDRAVRRESPVPGYPTSISATGDPPDPWAVLVAHDGVFRLLVMTLLGLPYERFWSLPFNLCSISVVSLSEGVPALRAHNLSEHLAPLAVDWAAEEEMRGDRRGAL